MAAGSIKKEPNGTYYFVVDIGKDGERKQVKRRGFEKKGDAQKALTKILDEVNNDNYMKESQMTIDDLVEKWLNEKSIDKSLTKITISNNRSYTKNHISPLLGKTRLDKLEKKHVVDFLKQLRNKKSKYNTSYSDSTIQRAYIVLVAALNYAKKEKLIKENIASTITRPRIEKKQLMVWNVNEINSFLTSVKKSRYYIVYYLAIHTGMRQGEILGLSWNNIDLSNKIIRVTQILERDGKSIKHGTKTNSGMRSISISDDVVIELGKHKTRMDQEKEYYNEKNNLLVFTSKGKPVYAETITKIMRRKIKDINLQPIRFHDLRHTSASLMLMLGIHPKIVSERLGHSSVTITLDTYSHLLPNMQEAAAKGLSNLLNNTDV